MEKYVLITGGELRNKGAQAMTYISVDYFAKNYPEYEIIVFSDRDFNRSPKEKSNYKFEILPFPGFGETLSLRTGLLKNRYIKRNNGKIFSQYKSIFENTVALIDISGYALGSNWRKSTVDNYIRRIAIAKRFGIPVYLMPQSFGPFDFKGFNGWLTNRKIKHYLSYASCIMAREQEGLQLLRERYKLKNVIKTNDLVLQNKGVELNRVFNIIPNVDVDYIEKGSVAIIPNSKNEANGNKDEIMSLYKKLIEKVTYSRKKVYLIYHALEDLKICREIKNRFFADDESVIVIENELSSIEFGKAVSLFDFIIASRYHSIVHAYKESVPSVILGWAVKYIELADVFEQKKFCFDVRDKLEDEKIMSAIEHMIKNSGEESQKISEKLEDIQSSNVYDLIELR